MKRNILIVDDQPEIAELLDLYLEKAGYNIIQARDGMDALKCIFQRGILI
ncbi:DNA-binding response OmpR family regulator OS=Ureibacillus acetophenoni OX=614649 GN=SAMN05877842_11476 PE=4 SV=1 [Ureibacillus acetophenoni]